MLVFNIEEFTNILTLKDISLIGVFLIIIYVLWKENQQLKKRIDEVIKEHQDDLKEENKSMQVILEKYHKFTEQIKEIIKK